MGRPVAQPKPADPAVLLSMKDKIRALIILRARKELAATGLQA